MTEEEIEEVEREEEYEQQKLREFDQQVRLTTFRWHSNKFASQIIRQVYGNNLKETDPTWQSSRVKLFDNVRTQKNQMLARLEVSLPPYGKWITVKCYLCRITSRQLAKNVRSNGLLAMMRFEVLNASTFQHIWYYLEGRLDFDRSEDLGKYFIRSKFILELLTGIVLLILVYFHRSDIRQFVRCLP